ncbi:MAG: IS4 family transposase [Planctomycetota bacterium]|nr:IS4 family transposase [Planctomycetota bacterium]
MTIPHSSAADIFQTISRSLPGKRQRRRGSLGPAQVLYTVMHMSAGATTGYRGTLDYLTRQVGEKLGWEYAPWSSSFSEARRKLSAAQCRHAFSIARQSCAGLTGSPKVCYGEYRILAVDMTKLALPAYKDVVDGFGCPKDRLGKTAPAPQATLTVLWDVSTNTPVDWRLERVYASERFAGHSLINSIGKQDLLIADRGYPSRRLLKEISDLGASYLIRMPSGRAGGFVEVRQFMDDPSAWDREIKLHETNAKTDDPTIRVRLLKHRLPGGGFAVFATNLFGSRRHRRRALCDLYCYRWDIETAFREMKVWHGLENFKARYAEGVHQEVAGLMLFMLLTAELEAQARHYHAVPYRESEAGTAREPEYRFNRKQIAETVGHLLAAAADGSDAVRAEFIYCMKQLWRYRQRRKPGRSFARTAKNPNSKYKKSTYNANKKAKHTKASRQSLAE